MWRTAPVRSAVETRRPHEPGAAWFVVEGVRFFFGMTGVLRFGQGAAALCGGGAVGLGPGRAGWTGLLCC